MVTRKPFIKLVLAVSVTRSFIGSDFGIQNFQSRLGSALENMGVAQNSATSPYTPAANLSLLDFRFENFKEVSTVCGAKKCLFQLQADDRIGYLAASSRVPKLVQGMEESYKFNIEVIEKQYGMKTVLLAPPHLVEVDDSFIQWASTNITRGYQGQKQLPRFNTKKLIVQPVEIVHESESLLFGCEGPRFLSGTYLLEKLFDVENTRGKDLKSISETITAEFAKLYRLMEDYACLYDDFQIFLTQEGRLVHLDVDRCFDGYAERRGESIAEDCLPFIQSFEAIVLHRLHLLSSQ
jgi:hypothetical protein